jgi:biofilm protein TabA
MIIDAITNASAYASLSSDIASALGFIRRHDLAELPEGKHEIDGDRIYAIIQEYSTKPAADCFWEAHRRYIDVQFVQRGVEHFGWAPLQKLTVEKEYNQHKDLIVLKGSGQTMELTAGNFAIFMPCDAHMPGISGDHPHKVRKIVVKVAVE